MKSNPLLLHTIWLAGLLALCLPIAAHAKRTAPPKVEAVVIGDVRFSVENLPRSMGVVTASQANTGKTLWTIRLYRVSYIPGLEKDVQDVFVRKMWSEGGKLRVIDERDRAYEVDPASRKASRVKRAP